MTDSLDKNPKTPEKSNPIKKDDGIPGNLFTDPEYILLTREYQNAEFEKSRVILTALLAKYPGQPRLVEFQKDLNLQLSLKDLATHQVKAGKQKKLKSRASMTLFTVISSLIVVVIFIGSYILVNSIIQKQNYQQDQAQLTSLEGQAQQLLISGQPEVALEVVERMRGIDPNYASLSSLTEQLNSLLLLSTKYQNTADLLTKNEKASALTILKEIESEHPGLWDVRRKIQEIEKSLQIDQFMMEGNAAYLKGDWAQVVESYEAALALDPKLDDSVMKEQLLNGYLRSIIGMLESDSTSIEEIEKAEQYYRRAVAMIPQSRAFANERENLQEVSSNLLELKFTQTAKAMLVDKNQSLTSISKAVSYFSKAVNLNPKNSQLQTDLRNAQLYQIAFQNFAQMNWAPAIDNLNRLLVMDKGYASGNAALLLYEAYYSLGSQYYSVGLYLDAQLNFDAAEKLAWEESDNLLKLFQVQVMLGNTYGKLRNYKEAVSYYQYALTSIKIYPRVDRLPELSGKLYSAEGLAAQGESMDAYTAYQEALQMIDGIYTIQEVDVENGTCLAFFADAHHSTVDAIARENSLPKTMILNFDQKLNIPSIEKPAE